MIPHLLSSPLDTGIKGLTAVTQKAFSYPFVNEFLLSTLNYLDSVFSTNGNGTEESRVADINLQRFPSGAVLSKQSIACLKKGLTSELLPVKP